MLLTLTISSLGPSGWYILLNLSVIKQFIIICEGKHMVLVSKTLSCKICTEQFVCCTIIIRELIAKEDKCKMAKSQQAAAHVRVHTMIKNHHLVVLLSAFCSALSA